jgi:DNA-directed RNA polymerase subunit RPC12/RpoP
MSFKCPECGSERFEEVLINVVEYINIDDIHTDDEGNSSLVYGDHSSEGGDVECYQCMQCGTEVASCQDELIELMLEK